MRSELQAGDIVLVKGCCTQRLERISPALQGHPIRCDIEFRNLRGLRCDTCPTLATGWTGNSRGPAAATDPHGHRLNPDSPRLAPAFAAP